jgi:hypothetical protein
MHGVLRVRPPPGAVGGERRQLHAEGPPPLAHLFLTHLFLTRLCRRPQPRLLIACGARRIKDLTATGPAPLAHDFAGHVRRMGLYRLHSNPYLS